MAAKVETGTFYNPSRPPLNLRDKAEGWHNLQDKILYYSLYASAITAIGFAGYQALILATDPETPSLIRSAFNLIGGTP